MGIHFKNKGAINVLDIQQTTYAVRNANESPSVKRKCYQRKTGVYTDEWRTPEIVTTWVNK